MEGVQKVETNADLIHPEFKVDLLDLVKEFEEKVLIKTNILHKIDKKLGEIKELKTLKSLEEEKKAELHILE
jgi:hypothetical protein